MVLEILQRRFKKKKKKKKTLEFSLVLPFLFKHGMKFRRLFVTDHCGPRVDAIDNYLDLMREMLPRNAFFAVNCHGGFDKMNFFLSFC